MPATEAQIRANQANSKLSTGPKTAEGKERSRSNSYKHGLTGDGIVLPQHDSIEVDRRADAFACETNAYGEVGHTLARIMALNSVRMERVADQQTAALSEHVRQIQEDFEAPENVDDAEARRLFIEATRRAMFDTSREAILARKYEAAAERGFFRAMNELRRLEKLGPPATPMVEDQAVQKTLASIFQMEAKLAAIESRHAEPLPDRRPMPSNRFEALDLAPSRAGADVPFAIGRAR